MKLINETKVKQKFQPDPFILEVNGKFYIYCTSTDGVQAYRSTSLIGEYEDIGKVLEIEDKKHFWAPSVIKTNGKYYMYVSCMNDNEKDAHFQTMYVASADSPTGPFSDAKPLIKPFAIDSHVVENESGLYIFYSTNDYTGDRIGTYICVDKMTDPEHVSGNPVPVVKPTLDEEIFMKNRFGDGKDWHTLEGAFYFKEGDYQYVIYSGNCYTSPYYYLGYAVAKTHETDLTKIKFKKYPSENIYAPLIARNEFEEGTGHNSVIKYNGEYYVVYHGRDKGVVEANGEDKRTARICKLIVDGEKLTAIRKENSL